jgi:hypothetical protein
MSARNKEAEEGIFELPLELGGIKVGKDVVDRYKGLSLGPGKTLGKGESDKEGTHQSWPGGGCHTIEVRGSQASLPEGLPDYAADPLKVGTAGYFRNDTLVFFVERNL